MELSTLRLSRTTVSEDWSSKHPGAQTCGSESSQPRFSPVLPLLLVCEPTATIIAALWSEQAAKVTFWQSTDFYGLNLTSLADAASQDHFAQAIVG